MQESDDGGGDEAAVGRGRSIREILHSTTRLPSNNPYVGTFYHGMLLPPLYTYADYALHSPHVPFLRHAAHTTPIAKIVHDMMVAEERRRQQCGEDDWVFVEEDSS